MDVCPECGVPFEQHPEPCPRCSRALVAVPDPDGYQLWRDALQLAASGKPSPIDVPAVQPTILADARWYMEKLRAWRDEI